LSADYDMPGMKGDQLAAAIKALVSTEPVVMVTARSEAVQSDPSHMKHIDRRVPKPFRIETLRAAIDQALAGKRLPPGLANR
jgi:CheY-like chemotaxis protein